ncbi:nucleic-acid-binding protein from transposon X-element [Trichonephila clavipes]|nr:nucleic-acid-binding protein from transposon X-element [Trichonephila clavipes]
MECQNIPLPTSRSSTPELSTPCEQLIQIHSNIRKFSLLAKGTDYLLAETPLALHEGLANKPMIRTLGYWRVVDLFARRNITRSQSSTGRHPESPNFTLETDNKFSNLKQQEIAGTSNDNTTTNDPPPAANTPKTYLPPPIMLKTSEETREHMKVITTAFPNIRSKLSGELIKLYTNTSIDYHKLLNLLDQHQFQYHVITPKDEWPIKVVIKGLPCNTDINDIKSDLTDQGFTDTKVSQLIGRITKQKLPVFMITLPRNINNAKIFQLKTLSYLSIRVEGYEGTGVTQCYKCNRFNHTSDNCHMIPRCLKCGEAHQTKDCPIQRVETASSINCQAYGHMANYSKCPLFPKPRKGKTIKNNYTTVVDSIVRPNITYAQATNNKKSDQYKNTQQMAPRVNDAPAISSQNQTNRPFNKPPATQEFNLIENSPQFAILQTLQQTMHTLAILTQQIASLNFNALAPHPKI